MPSWKKLIVSGSDAILNGVIATSGFTGSLSGSVIGTSSWANSASNALASVNATSASHAVTASHAFNAISSSYALTSSYASASTSASYAGTSSYNVFTNIGPGLNLDNEYSALIGGLFSATSYFGTPQQYLSMSYNPVRNRLWVGNVTASSFTGSLSGSVAGTASWATSASHAITASRALSTVSASHAVTASHAFFAITATSATSATSASYASASTSASYAGTSSFNILTNIGPGLNLDNEYSALIGGVYSATSYFGSPQQYLSMSYNPVRNRLWVGNVTASSFTGSLSGSVTGTATSATSASHAVTASHAFNAISATSASHAVTASHAFFAITASHAVTASRALSAISSSHAVTSSHAFFAISSSHALSASYASASTSASYASTSSFTTTASFAQILGGYGISDISLGRRQNYTSISTGVSNDWYPIFAVDDINNGTIVCSMTTYAHSDILFAVSKGYGPSGVNTITILNSMTNDNGGFANIIGVRVLDNGTVEVQLYWTSGPTVDIRVAIWGAGDSMPSFNSTLVANTGAVTVHDSVDTSVLTGKIRSQKGFIGTGGTSIFGGVTATSFTGSLSGSVDGTASWATSASQAISSSYTFGTINVSTYTPTLNSELFSILGEATSGRSALSGYSIYTFNPLYNRLTVGNVSASSFTGSLSGSVEGTASWANNVISASHAVTASHAFNAITATSATSATIVDGTSGQNVAKDDRIIEPDSITSGRMQFGFTSWTNDNNSPYADYLHLRSYLDGSGGSDNLVMFRKDAIGMRIWQQTFNSSTAYASYKDVAWTDGTNATGTWTIGISGNAGTVTNGVYTTGSQDILGVKSFICPSNTFINTVASANYAATLYQDTVGADAYLTFHIGGDYAGYFGLGGAENDLVWGGWSVGNNRYRILHTGNYTSYVPTLTGTGATGTWNITSSQAISASYTFGTINVNTSTPTTNLELFAILGESTAGRSALSGYSIYTFNPLFNRLTVGNVSASSFTGSLNGTASWATSASWAPGGSTFPYTGTAIITGSIIVTTGSAFSVLTAAETLTAGDFVNIYSGGVRKATSSGSNRFAHGFVINNYSIGNTVVLYYNGLNTSKTGLTAGARYFVSSSGAVATTAATDTGNTYQEVGVAISSTAILVNLGPSVIV